MSRLDALPADQRAVLQLLLRQGKGYEDLSALLRLEAAAVRSRAYDALDALGPGAAGLGAERRRAIGDWLLGQQDPADAATTRGFLAGSEAGRAWARAVGAELAPLAGDRLPDVPGESEPHDDATAEVRRDPAAAPRVSRRGGAILIGAALAVIVAALVIVLATRGGGRSAEPTPATAAKTTSTAAAKPTVRAQANLTAPKGAPAPKALGIVQIVDVSGQQAINAVIDGLPASGNAGYGIWLSAPGRRKWLGYFQSVDKQGRAIAQGALDADVSRYREMLVTRETGRNPRTPGRIYLRGTIGGPPTSGGG